MKFLSVWLLALCCCLSVSAQIPSTRWAKTFGGSRNEKAFGMVQTVDNGFLVVGWSESNDGQVTGHHGAVDSSDAWVIKLNTDGALEWQRSYGSTGDDEFRSVVRLADGNYLCAGFASRDNGDVAGHKGKKDVWVVKLGRDGAILWQKCYGGTNDDMAAHISMASDGNALVIGRTNSNNNGDVSGFHAGLSAADSDIWILKVNASDGALMWQRCLGGNEDDYGTRISEVENGNLVVAGVAESVNTEFGAYNESAPSGKVGKFTPAFDLIWAYSNGRFTPTSFTRTPSNSIIFPLTMFGPVCRSPELVRALLQRVPANGPVSYIPSFPFGPDADRCGDGLYIMEGSDMTAVNNTDYLFVTMADEDQFTPVLNGLVVRFDTTGVIWKKHVGGSATDHLTSVLALNENEYVVSGHTASNDLDATGNHGLEDFWVVKLGTSNYITGNVFRDYNLNGVKDANEPFAKNILVESVKGSQTVASLTVNGIFLNTVDTGTYQTRIASLPSYQTAVPALHTSVFTAYGSKDSFSIALQAPPGSRDYRVSLIPTTRARPGFSADYILLLDNVGTDVLTNQQLKLVKDSRADLIVANPAPASVNGDTLIWNIAALNPGDSVSIVISTQVKAPPTVNIGDTLVLTASIDATGDLAPGDNISGLRQLVTGAVDPNDKTENAAKYFTTQEVAGGKYLSYVIRFQNTGTDTAFNIFIRDTLDPKLDWSTLEMISASHPYTLSVKNADKLTWTFEKILLPDSNVNEPASHGYISYRIRPRGTVAVGDVLRNSASIYFDLNLPVVTNTTETEIRPVIPPRPPAPQLTGLLNSYCSNLGVQKIRIANLPAAASGITVIVRLGANPLTVSPDSTLSFNVTALGAGVHQLWVEYRNSGGADTLIRNVTIVQAVTPDVNITAGTTSVVNEDRVLITATNAGGGGNTPLYTFSRNRSFTQIVQAESAANTFTIASSSLTLGDNLIYVRMRTSENCYTQQTAVDSVLIVKSGNTGLTDPDYPQQRISFNPNPFRHMLTVQGLSAAKSYTITIHNMQGTQVHKQRVAGRTVTALPLHRLTVGIYQVSIYDESKDRLIGTTQIAKQ